MSQDRVQVTIGEVDRVQATIGGVDRIQAFLKKVPICADRTFFENATIKEYNYPPSYVDENDPTTIIEIILSRENPELFDGVIEFLGYEEGSVSWYTSDENGWFGGGVVDGLVVNGDIVLKLVGEETFELSSSQLSAPFNTSIGSDFDTQSDYVISFEFDKSNPSEIALADELFSLLESGSLNTLQVDYRYRNVTQVYPIEDAIYIADNNQIFVETELTFGFDGYNVYRNENKVNEEPIKELSFSFDGDSEDTIEIASVAQCRESELFTVTEIEPTFSGDIDVFNSDANGSFVIIGRSGTSNAVTPITGGLSISSTLLEESKNNKGFILLSTSLIQRILRTNGTGTARYRVSVSYRTSSGTGTTTVTIADTNSLANRNDCDPMIFDNFGSLKIPSFTEVSETRYIMSISILPISGVGGVSPACEGQGTTFTATAKLF
jgi:hypothetical protein